MTRARLDDKIAELEHRVHNTAEKSRSVARVIILSGISITAFLWFVPRFFRSLRRFRR